MGENERTDGGGRMTDEGRQVLSPTDFIEPGRTSGEVGDEMTEDRRRMTEAGIR